MVIDFTFLLLSSLLNIHLIVENSHLRVLSLWVLGFKICETWKHLKVDGGLAIAKFDSLDLIKFNTLNSKIIFFTHSLLEAD